MGTIMKQARNVILSCIAVALFLGVVLFYRPAGAPPEIPEQTSSSEQPRRDTLIDDEFRETPPEQDAREAGKTSVVPPQPAGSRYPDNNELATAHIRFTDAGEPYLPFDIELDFQKNFSFSDGSAVPIHYKVRNRFNEPLDSALDDGVTPDFLDPLIAAAKRGNDQAAVHAYQEVQECRKYVDAEKRGVNFQEVASDTELNRCQLITDSSVERALQTLKEAADRGSAPAQELYAKVVVETDEEEARRYYRMLWDSGHSWGAGGLSQLAPPAEEITFEEQVEYEAFSYLSYAMTMAYYDGVNIDYVVKHASELAEDQQSRENGSSIVLQQEAQSLAKQMLVENRNCCVSFVSKKEAQ